MRRVTFNIRDVVPRIENNKIHIPFNGHVANLSASGAKSLSAVTFWNSDTTLIFDSDDYKVFKTVWSIKYPLRRGDEAYKNIFNTPAPTVLGLTVHAGVKVTRFCKIADTWVSPHGNSAIIRQFKQKYGR